jgi:hypothetical protein
MVKRKFYALSIVVIMVCLSLVFTILVLNVASEEDFSDTNFSVVDFPLDIDFSNNVFHVGDKISGIITITNRNGKDVKVVSNGYMPCTYLHSINDETHMHPERMSRAEQILKTDKKMTQNFEWEAKDIGTYVLYVHYSIEVNGVELYSELEDIIIEVK